jgi:hypothetical protein
MGWFAISPSHYLTIFFTFCPLPSALCLSFSFSPNQIWLSDRKHLLPFGGCPVGVAEENWTVSGAGGEEACQKMNGMPFCQQDAGWSLPAGEFC